MSESNAFRGNRKVRTGTVTSDKMDKSITVAVERTYRHPVYKKVVRRTKRVLAHDEGNQCQVGDVVRIIESKPLSRRKRWRLQRIVSKVK
ncbi:MAG: 30S ribosomal protein S17 [Candidatus Poribacteria bacterium]|nr:30S ribosomal protein S17 [Candidatus Poribacteria bacterium]